MTPSMPHRATGNWRSGTGSTARGVSRRSLSVKPRARVPSPACSALPGHPRASRPAPCPPARSGASAATGPRHASCCAVTATMPGPHQRHDAGYGHPCRRHLADRQHTRAALGVRLLRAGASREPHRTPQDLAQKRPHVLSFGTGQSGQADPAYRRILLALVRMPGHSGNTPLVLRQAEFATLQRHLVKTAARVIETATRIRIACAAACPDKAAFIDLL